MAVEFNEENDLSQASLRAFAPIKDSGMVQFLINRGIVKDSAGANKVLIGIAIAFFAVSLYFFFF